MPEDQTEAKSINNQFSLVQFCLFKLSENHLNTSVCAEQSEF